MITLTQATFNGPGGVGTEIYYYPGPGDYCLGENIIWNRSDGAIAFQPNGSYPLTGPVRFYGNGFTMQNAPYSNTLSIAIAGVGHSFAIRDLHLEGFQQGILLSNVYDAEASHYFENVTGRNYLYSIKALGKRNTYVNCVAYHGGGSGHIVRPTGFWNEGIDPRFINSHVLNTEINDPGVLERESIGINLVGCGTNGFSKGCSIAHKVKYTNLAWGYWFNRDGANTPQSFRVIDGYAEKLHSIFGGDLDSGDLRGRFWDCDYVIPAPSWGTGKYIDFTI